MLARSGADLNLRYGGQGVTPLHMASDHGRVGAVFELLSAGADRSLKNEARKAAAAV